MAETYESVLRIAETLDKAEQVKLARKLLNEARFPESGERVSIMELEGLGKEIWAGIDTDAYLKAERDSWER